jgi:hypothetical protein
VSARAEIIWSPSRRPAGVLAPTMAPTATSSCVSVSWSPCLPSSEGCRKPNAGPPRRTQPPPLHRNVRCLVHPRADSSFAASAPT